MPPRLRRASADEVRRRWAALSFEKKQDLMRFDEPCLVERIKCALQALFQKQELMNTLGIKLTTAADPFAASALFTTAFEFTWQIARSARNPSVVLVDPMCMPVMAVKAALLEGSKMFQEMEEVLHDFASEKSGRQPIAKARWKDLFATEPSSVSAMEQQLVKLVEQVLWAVAADPTLEAQGSEERQLPEDVPFEPWMETSENASSSKSGDTKKRKNKKKQRGTLSAPVAAPSEVTSVCSAETLQTREQEEIEEDDQQLEAHRQLEEEEEEEVEGQAPDGVFHTDDATKRWEEEEGTFDTGSAGTGTTAYPGEASASEVSREITAVSTPSWASATSRLASRGLQGSPFGSQATSSKQQLVCYIWNQAAQCSAGPSSPRSSGPQAAARFARGQWTSQVSTGPGTPVQPHTPVLSAVVRRTFVDIADPCEPKTEMARTSRSLSPRHFRYDLDPSDPWFYHWHV